MNKEHTFICGERIDPEIINEFINDGKKINKLLKDIEANAYTLGDILNHPTKAIRQCRHYML